MAFDAHSNFGYSTVAVAPSPANTGTSLQVAAGQGALFPAAPFNCTIWPPGVNPIASNAEIIRVTAVVGDVFTITRAQESTSNKSVEVGWQIANTTSVKVFTDIESAPVISAGTTQATGPFTFADSNGVTFGIDNGTVTASVATAAGGGVAVSAGANSQSTGTIVFANSNGITWGLDGAGNLTASHDGLTSQSNQAFSAQGGSSAFQTLIFADSNGLSFSNSNGSVIASYTVPNTAGLISVVGLSGGTQSNGVTAIVFSNANGVTWGVDGSTVTASVAAAGGGSINFSAGTTSNNLASITFANSNGVTWGLDNGTITASVNTAAGGAATTRSFFENIDLGNNTSFQSWWYQSLVCLDPLPLYTPLLFNSIRQIISAGNSFPATGNDSFAYTGSVHIGFYSRSVTDSGATNFSNSSILSLHTSNLWTIQATISLSSSSKTATFGWQTDSTGGSETTTQSTNSQFFQIPGFRERILLNIPFRAELSAGDWWIGRLGVFSMGGGPGSGAASRIISSSFLEMTLNANSTNLSGLNDTGLGNTDGRNLVVDGCGFYTSTSNAMPNSINMVSEMSQGNFAQGRRWYMMLP